MFNIDEKVSLIRDMRRNIETAGKVKDVTEALRKVCDTSLERLLSITEELPKCLDVEELYKHGPSLMETYRRGLELSERPELLSEEGRGKLNRICSERLLEVVEQFNLSEEELDRRSWESEVSERLEKEYKRVENLLPYWKEKIASASRVPQWKHNCSKVLPVPEGIDIKEAVEDYLEKEAKLKKTLHTTLSSFMHELCNKDESTWITLKRLQYRTQAALGVSVSSLTSIIEEMGFNKVPCMTSSNDFDLLEFERKLEQSLSERGEIEEPILLETFIPRETIKDKWGSLDGLKQAIAEGKI